MDGARSPRLTRKSLLDLWAALHAVSSRMSQTVSCHTQLCITSSPAQLRAHTVTLPTRPGKPGPSTLLISGFTGSSPMLTLPLIAVRGASSKFYTLFLTTLSSHLRCFPTPLKLSTVAGMPHSASNSRQYFPTDPIVWTHHEGPANSPFTGTGYTVSPIPPIWSLL